MYTSFMKRNFMFIFFSFVLMIFSCSAINADYHGNVGDTIEDGECLILTANQDNSSVSFKWNSAGTMQYETDNSKYWNGNNSNPGWQPYLKGTKIDLNKDNHVKFRGSGVTTNIFNHFSMEGSISARGCVDSLRIKSLDQSDTDDYGKFAGLANFCYYYMFAGCTSLTTAPKLSATTLYENCYRNMFDGCTSLENAPNLPATNLANGCYSYMFIRCANLKKAPELSATALANSCYSNIFSGCTSLTTAPNLSSTNLAQECYSSMFNECTNLKIAPKLPATNLAPHCYNSMFQKCTNLTTAPELPATTLALGCYRYMFYGCKSLKNAPNLPATNLANGCYSSIFAGCSSLDLSKTKDDNHVYPWKFKVNGNGYNFSISMLPIAVTPDRDGCVTLYSKYPLSSYVNTAKNENLISSTTKNTILKNSQILTTIIRKVSEVLLDKILSEVLVIKNS